MQQATLKRRRLSYAVRALGYAALVLLLPTTVQAAVQFDTKTCYNSGSGTTRTFAHPVGTGQVNQLLMVGISWSGSSVNISGVTYNSIAMTAVAAQVANSSTKMQMYRLTAPTTGSNNVVVTFSASASSAVISATSYYGVHQTTPLGTFVSATGTSTAPSVTATSVGSSDIVVDTLAAAGGTPTVDATQTQQCNLTQTVRGASSTEPYTGLASVPMSWTLSSSNAWSIGAVPIKPAAVGAFTKLQLLVPGETAAPWTTTGKTGTPTGQTKGTAFTVTVNAVDANWNLLTGAPADSIQITSTDTTATLPANAGLSSGARTFSVTLNTKGSWTATATDATNPGGITANT